MNMTNVQENVKLVGENNRTNCDIKAEDLQSVTRNNEGITI